MKSKAITSSTMIPISFLAFLTAGILWLTTMHSNLSHASNELAEIKRELKEVVDSRQSYRVSLWESQMTIDKRLSKSEGQLDVLIFSFENRPP